MVFSATADAGTSFYFTDYCKNEYSEENVGTIQNGIPC